MDAINDKEQILSGLDSDLSPSQFQKLVEQTTSTAPPCLFAAVEEHTVIGLTSFRKHIFTSGAGDELIAYQAAGVLTAPQSRGKGVFTRIVREAERVLAEQGASLIFGFPNSNAFPIWTKKLHYESEKLIRWKSVALCGSERLFIDPAYFEVNKALRQDEEDLIASKAKFYKNMLVAAEIESSVIWGVLRPKSFGCYRARIFDVGGVRCTSGQELRALFRIVSTKIGGPYLARLQTVASNPLSSVLRDISESGVESDALIYKFLGNAPLGFSGLAVFTGAAEWF